MDILKICNVVGPGGGDVGAFYSLPIRGQGVIRFYPKLTFSTLTLMKYLNGYVPYRSRVADPGRVWIRIRPS